MSILIELAIYAALAAAAAFAFHEFEQVYYIKPAQAGARAEQLAADQKVLDQVKAERDAAQTNAKTNADNFAGCDAKLTAQGQSAAKDAARAAALVAANHAAAQAAQAKTAEQQVQIAKLMEEAAATPVPGQSCITILNKIDAIERAGARERRAK